MIIQYDSDFDILTDDSLSAGVLKIEPKVLSDERGSFTEVLNSNVVNINTVVPLLDITQINRSSSKHNVIRGMHAQFGKNCQAKLVECITGLLYDIIIDLRPQSMTFGKIKTYILDSKINNKVFVPKGFLHGIFSPQSNVEYNILQYFIYGSNYNSNSEITINVKSCIDDIILSLNNDQQNIKNSLLNVDSIIFNEKDLNGISLDEFKFNISSDYNKYKKVWYK